MIDLYVIGPIILFLLSTAFIFVWAVSRPNSAALLWGVAHAAYGIAILAGFYYQQHPIFIFGAIGLVTSCIYMATFWLAPEAVEGRRVSLGLVCAYVIGMMLISVAISEVSGRAAFSAFSIVVLLRSGDLFFRRLHMPWIGGVFYLKAASYLSAFGDPAHFDTYLQPFWMLAVHWSTNFLLAISLIYLAVHQSRNRLSQLLQHLPDALVAAKLDGTVIFCNDAFAKLCGAKGVGALLGKPVPLLGKEFSEGHVVSKEFKSTLAQSGLKTPTVLERDILATNGHYFPAELMFSSFRDFGGIVVLVQIHDQSERKRAEEDRLRQSTIDKVTSLPNRAYLEELLTDTLKDSQLGQLQCAVLMIDLDHFMRVNDTMGHAAGDDLIAQVSKVLIGVARPKDVLGRFGGDEFLIIATELPVAGESSGANRLANAMAEDIAKSVCTAIARSFSIDGVDVRLGASIGIALMSASGNTAANMIQRAELAMYEAKEKGRGTWSFFDKRMDGKLLENIRMDAALRSAIELGELQLLYQPILDGKTGKIAKAEALIRWNSSEFGLVRPNSFIPILEQSALILEIGKWVIEDAVKQSAQWHSMSDSAPVVSINISTRQFLDPEFEGDLMQVLRRHGVQPAHIELELTETVLAADDPGLIALLKRLGDAGVSISLDDFGTGYSSLSYLARFDVNTVKIDRSFISDLELDSRHRSLVKVIIAMGHSLDLKVVAEGVETAAQKEFLLAHHCDYLQGYLFSEPVVPGEINF